MDETSYLDRMTDGDILARVSEGIWWAWHKEEKEEQNWACVERGWTVEDCRIMKQAWMENDLMEDQGWRCSRKWKKGADMQHWGTDLNGKERRQGPAVRQSTKEEKKNLYFILRQGHFFAFLHLGANQKKISKTKFFRWFVIMKSWNIELCTELPVIRSITQWLFMSNKK